MDQQTHDTIVKPKRKIKKCNECNKKRIPSNENHQICYVCYNAKSISKSGNKAIDDFIRYTQINNVRYGKKMVFVPYDRFENVKFIAEGGFSKIYKAIWIDGSWDNIRKMYNKNEPVVLKKLNNSKNVTSKELNELKIFYEFSLKHKIYKNDTYISKYYGITQDPITQDIMIIMPYYTEGDLVHYITNDFYSISWNDKLGSLYYLTSGLKNIHKVNIVHRDLHSGNIFFGNSTYAVIGDLGISKSATDDNNNENYGIIPYMAPEIFHGQKYTTASDIYSFGMIMWEFMTGRRPFWDRNHDIKLIIKICDGERPSIVTNAPEGYIELMKECWHSDPEKRPSAIDAYNKIDKMYDEEKKHFYRKNPTEVVESPDIGPVKMNNPGAIYKSRPLSGMIQSAMSTRSLRSQNLETDLFRHYQKSHISFYGKRKFEDQIENNFINSKRFKKMKLIEDENNDYTTKELEFDVDTDFKQDKNDHEYTTQEVHFDINTF